MIFLNYIPMILFSLIGRFGPGIGPGIEGCSWATAYFCTTPIAILILMFFILKKHKIRSFLIAAGLYLCVSTGFILVGFERGYLLLADLMASAFFLVFFIVHLFQVLFPYFCDRFMEAEPKLPFITLSLYLGVVIVSFLFRNEAIWLSALMPFLAARWLISCIEKRRAHQSLNFSN